MVRGACSDGLLDTMATGDCRLDKNAGIEQKKNIRLGVLQQARDTTPLQLSRIFPGIATNTPVSQGNDQTRYTPLRCGGLPRPVKLIVRAHKAVSGIVDD